MAYKQFQKDAIAKIVKGYESDKHNNRFLVADEVGLGKTYIAKGVIRCLLYYHYLEEKRENPNQTAFEFKVLYLCSNLNIAEQNKRKLGISNGKKTDFFDICIKNNNDFQSYRKDSDENTGSSIENRTTMLLKQQIYRVEQGEKISVFRDECIEILGKELVDNKERDCKIDVQENQNDSISLNIIPITPNTSIKIRNGGHVEERRFISDVLKVVKCYIEEKKIENSYLEKLLDNIFYEVNNLTQYFSLDCEEIRRLCTYLPAFTTALGQLLANGELNINDLSSEDKYKGLAGKIDAPKDGTWDIWKEGWELLRKWFALASMELLKYDFVVMDEFQNFNDILQKANQTQIAKQKYISQVKYIFTILNQCGGAEQKIDSLKNIITGKFKDIEEVTLTDYEKNFWEQKLKEETDNGHLEQKRIEDIIEQFFKMSKPDTKIADGETNQTKSDLKEKVEILQLVKVILNYQNTDEYKQIILDYYNDLNKPKVLNLLSDLSKIEYVEKFSGQEKDCECKTEEKYGKKYLRGYPVNENLLNMSIDLDCESFEKQYKDLRGIHPYPLKGEKYSKTPFDYFIYLFLKKDENSPNPELLLNCFQYFYKKNNQNNKNNKSIIIWQYAYILSNLLAEDDNRYSYTIEQLEPLRNMLGTYEKRESASSDNIDEQMILKHIFRNEVIGENVTRILMLSATPFKMYDNNDEDDQKNANIMEVCDFLDHNSKNNVSQQLIEYKNALLDYSNSNKEFNEVMDKKQNFQNAMNSIFTRMERYAVLRSMNNDWFDNMVDPGKETGVGQSELPCGQIDNLKNYMNEIKEMKVDSPFIKFAVDSPYMGTFMHSNSKDGNTNSMDDSEGYKWKVRWKNIYKDIEYNDESKVYISYETFRNNEKPLGLWHGVFNETLRKILDLDNIEGDKDNHPGAARLLWVPSCVNKDNLKGPFAEHKDYGKTILFSRYLQTPRMVTCLTSYESRRRLCWMIERKWGKDEDKKECFKQYIKELAEKFEINGKNADNGNQTEEEKSTYQYLKGIIKKIKEPLCNRLLDENSFLKNTFDNAIKGYYKKKYTGDEENTDEEARLKHLVEELTKAFANKILLNDEQGLMAIWASYGFPEIKQNISKENFVEACYEKTKQYCEDGALADALAEWFYICFESDQDFGEFIGLKKGEFLSFVKESRITIDLYMANEDGKIEEYREENKDNKSTNNAILYFARCIGMSKDDDNINAVKGLQQAFNSPFAPFVFATTSMGQEGLDFHYYADNIVHWKLPSNPVDFEQREGRINRYHCLAIRKKVIEWWGNSECNQENKDVYQMFTDAFNSSKIALTEDNSSQSPIKKCEMVPDWILMNKDKSKSAQIRRIVPYFYLSKMAKEYNQNLRILQLYRTVIGQGNPEEIMERLLSSKDTEEVKELFVDFSPYQEFIMKNCKWHG